MMTWFFFLINTTLDDDMIPNDNNTNFMTKYDFDEFLHGMNDVINSKDIENANDNIIIDINATNYFVEYTIAFIDLLVQTYMIK